jgi:hypothetical protein
MGGRVAGRRHHGPADARTAVLVTPKHGLMLSRTLSALLEVLMWTSSVVQVRRQRVHSVQSRPVQ